MRELEAAADASLVDAIRIHAQWQQPCEVLEKDGVLLVAGSTSFPAAYKNCVARTAPTVDPRQLLAAADAFFGERARNYTVFIREQRDADIERELIESQRFEKRSDAPCMLVTQALAVPAVPEGIRVERLTQSRHVLDIATVLKPSYEMLGYPSAEVDALYAPTDRVLSSPTTGFVAYRGDEPAACALTLHSGTCSGVYWVGTVPSAQRLGLGGLCTALATNAGFEAGAKVMTLQASPFGAPVYERLGYRLYDRLRWYRASRSDHAGAEMGAMKR